MSPGTSPVFKDPSTGQDTNTPPAGNLPYTPGPPRWVLAQHLADEDPVPIPLRNQGNP